MTLNLALQCSLVALLSAWMLVLSEASPAMADEDGEKLKLVFKILTSADGEVKARVLELEQQGKEIPLAAEAYHLEALSEYIEAKRALGSGDSDLAKIHTMKAMDLFKQATDLLSTSEKGQEQTDILIEIDEKLLNLQHQAEYLRTLANLDEVSADFSDYDTAISSVKHALEDGSSEAAMEQLADAKLILADIQTDIQIAADSRHEERKEEFAQNIITRLSGIVPQTNNQSAATGHFIEELKRIIDQLKNAKSVEEIMDMTDDSSNLQVMIRDYKDHIDSIAKEEKSVTSGITDEVRTPGADNATGVSHSSIDTIKPSISLPSDITQEATGHLTYVKLDSPMVSDNEDPSPKVSNDAPLDGFPVGTTVVTWTVTDKSGNSAAATQSVTITDTTAPSIAAPKDIIVKATGVLTAIDLGSPTVSDIVDNSPTIANNAPLDGFPVGTTVITWTATDKSGNSATATQIVTIIVSVPPIIALPL